MAEDTRPKTLRITEYRPSQKFWLGRLLTSDRFETAK
jgi:hypothetical protein